MPSVLHLPMKKKWFDLVRSGEKKEEYRLFKPYWMKRIRTWIDASLPHNCSPYVHSIHGRELIYEVYNAYNTLPIIFFNGYQKDAPRHVAYCHTVEIRKDAIHPEWGEYEYNGQPHFVLHLMHMKEENE